VTAVGLGLGERAGLWLPLLRQLTEVSSEWVVWKNVDSALDAGGDIDSAAPARDWPKLREAFLHWAARFDLWPAAICDHIPGGLNLVAAPVGSPLLLELSIKQSKAWRGSTLFVLDDLLPLTEWDERGFRRLRPGAEGILKLLLNGTQWGGRPNRSGLEAKRVRAELVADLEGVRQCAQLFGAAAGSAEAAAAALTEGGWDRGAVARLELHALLGAIRQPAQTAKRIRFRLFGARTCPVIEALADDRRIPPDRAGWLQAVERTHPTTFWPVGPAGGPWQVP
jgi:hypothetical protein